ncbi:Exo-beta-1,3-glucanase [Thalassocella blandensis]|nr:Exo-beta-1,3-glucanase [Thalassocella blandensis]
MLLFNCKAHSTFFTRSAFFLTPFLVLMLNACDKKSEVLPDVENQNESKDALALSVTPAPVTFDPAFYHVDFGKNVLVFDPSMDTQLMQDALDRLHEQQAFDEFSSQRYALLFKPGQYNLNITVDYYTQALGLGQLPSDTRINGAVQSVTTTEGTKVTTMFWRSAENFYVKPQDELMYWAVSQAAPYRRMHVAGNVNFDKHGWASGGVLANSIIEGRAGLTSGQQWFVRNSQVGKWEGGNWNRVFVGVEGAPARDWPKKPTTVIDATPIVREKPQLMLNEQDEYVVFVPEVRHNTSGVSWLPREGKAEAGKHIPLHDFYIARADKDDSDSINAALKQGKHLLLTPGVYKMEETIHIEHADTVVYGLGLPTIIPIKGQTAIETADKDGIILAGVMVDAGLLSSPSLITVGEEKASADHAQNPVSLHDVYCRVGGALYGTADTCLTINSHQVLVDHVWLWRADHGVGADWEINKSRHGLVVNGDDVTIYGLFNEHFQEYQTVWNGERGRTYFYQSEIPYQPPSYEAWNDGSKMGFASYKVADSVTSHQAWGLGIYSFFRGKSTIENNMRLSNAIEAPEHAGIEFQHMIIFAGLNGGIDHVINGQGPSVNVGELKFFERFNGAEASPTH